MRIGNNFAANIFNVSNYCASAIYAFVRSIQVMKNLTLDWITRPIDFLNWVLVKIDIDFYSSRSFTARLTTDICILVEHGDYHVIVITECFLCTASILFFPLRLSQYPLSWNLSWGRAVKLTHNFHKYKVNWNYKKKKRSSWKILIMLNGVKLQC